METSIENQKQILIDGPAWDLNSIYSSVTSNEYLDDAKKTKSLILEIEKLAKTQEYHLMQPGDLELDPQDLEVVLKMFDLSDDAETLARTASFYTSALLSIDFSLAEVRKAADAATNFESLIQQAMAPAELLVIRMSEKNYQQLLSVDQNKKWTFAWGILRKKKDFILPKDQEQLLSQMESAGFRAWGELYSSLSGAIQCTVELNGKTKVVGLATALGMTKVEDEPTRKAAWLSVQKAWSEHRETASSIVNALATWRLEICKKRSTIKPMHFLDSSLLSNRMSRTTLDALLKACENNKAAMQKVGLTMAKMMGKKKLDPWDLLAACPVQTDQSTIAFDEAVKKVYISLDATDKEFSKFAKHMVDQKWVEGRVLKTKSPGGYCTWLPKTKEPRIFQTYLGKPADVMTLVHEMGHAYHGWITKRDLPNPQTDYPMTLAETASVFAEACWNDDQYTQAKTKEEKMACLWNEAERSMAFLLNIPTRFEFENSFYEKRAKGEMVTPDELNQLMNRAWEKWYGSCLASPDPLFWAHKLHFSSLASFYNYPYTFGFLFSLSVFARKKEMGDKFNAMYTALLRDTGRMTCEDLVKKHLNEDISDPQFWQKAIDSILVKMKDFEKLAEEF